MYSEKAEPWMDGSLETLGCLIWPLLLGPFLLFVACWLWGLLGSIF
jgi:hypothetical protein